jgi:hypothetical protein
MPTAVKADPLVELVRVNLGGSALFFMTTEEELEVVRGPAGRLGCFSGMSLLPSSPLLLASVTAAFISAGI